MSGVGCCCNETIGSVPPSFYRAGMGRQDPNDAVTGKVVNPRRSRLPFPHRHRKCKLNGRTPPFRLALQALSCDFLTGVMETA